MGIFDALLGGPKFNASKCKTALRLCVGRVKLLRNKKAHAVATLKREIGDLLNAGKEDSARVRVEAVLREEATLEAFEVLDLFCELLVVRLPLIESTKDLPADLKEAVATVVYAARRVADAIPELKEVRAQFAGKYGSQYVAACGEDATAGACGVSELAMRKLALAPPSAEARLEALRAVAAERGARFDEAKMAETTREAKMAETTRGPPPVAHASSPGDGAAFADAGQAAAAARAAAAEAAAAADAASRLASRDARAATATDAERTVGVITSRTPVPPLGFLVEALPPPTKGLGAERGKSVSQVIGARALDEVPETGGDEAENEAADAADANDADERVDGVAAVSAADDSSSLAEENAPKPKEEEDEEDDSVPDYARPAPPPGVGGTPPPPPPPPPPPRTAAAEEPEARAAEGDETEGNGDAAEDEDFDALASRLAALKRRDDE